MKRIPFLVFVFLGASTLGFYLIGLEHDSARSIVPGWHTEVYSPSFIIGLFMGIVLVLDAFAYWLLIRNELKIRPIFFLVHLGATLPAVMHQYFPGIIFNIELTDFEKLRKTQELRLDLVLVIWILFVSGQALFLIYFLYRYFAGKRLT